MAKNVIKVLIIDDDEADYFLARELLNDIDPHRFQVDWKPNFRDGLAALCEGKYDICLLDNRLGAETGIELLREAKKRSCQLPVILLTSQSERDIDYSAMELGAADFLEKQDLTAAKLDRAIRYTLLQHQQASDLERQVAERTRDLESTNSALQKEMKERERIDEALRESEERFRHLANAMPQIVWISDAEGRIEFINSQWMVYIGLSLDQSRHEELMQEVIHPDDRVSLQQSWKQAKENQSIHECEFRLKQYSEGNYRWFLSRSVPVFNAIGTLINWYGTSTDIHDQKMQEEEQRDANRRKDIFLATMAHELRNPLPAIRNALEIMRLSENNPETLERCRGMIERQLNQIIHLVDDLLDISRLTRGKINLRLEAVELTAIVDIAIETSRPVIEAAQHTLTLLLPEEKIYFEGDSTRLSQVIVNLLNNAAKYTNPKGEIVFSARKEDEQIILQVADNGMGIPPEMLQNIFQMFNQLPRSENFGQGGLGIGLAIVQGIVKLHHGTVEAQSAGIGKGSVFIVRIPVHQRPESDVELQPSTDQLHE